MWKFAIVTYMQHMTFSSCISTPFRLFWALFVKFYLLWDPRSSDIYAIYVNPAAYMSQQRVTYMIYAVTYMGGFYIYIYICKYMLTQPETFIQSNLNKQAMFSLCGPFLPTAMRWAAMISQWLLVGRKERMYSNRLQPNLISLEWSE